MNAKTLLLVSAFLAIAPLRAGDGVDLSGLPAPVRRALLEASGGSGVKQVTIRNFDGQTVYDAEFERKAAPNGRLRVTADGNVVRDTRPSAITVAPDAALFDPELGVVPVTPRFTLEDLPAAAQRAVQPLARGREIADIRRETLNGQDVFRVDFRESGRNPRLYVAADGTVVQPTEKPPGLGLGTTFDKTPAAVQEVVRRESAGGEIVKINRHGLVAEPQVYDVEIKNREATFQLRVSEDGQILRDTRKPLQPTGR